MDAHWNWNLVNCFWEIHENSDEVLEDSWFLAIEDKIAAILLYWPDTAEGFLNISGLFQDFRIYRQCSLDTGNMKIVSVLIGLDGSDGIWRWLLSKAALV